MSATIYTHMEYPEDVYVVQLHLHDEQSVYGSSII